ncbi:MAG: DNA polymerase I [Roseiflexaceae bacterium]
MPAQTLLLIDGHALAFRAFFALAEQGLRSSRGEPTYAIFGFASIMLNALAEHHPDYIAVSFDIGRTFRDEMYAEYKAGRAETPEEFHPQLERIKELLNAFNIPIYTKEGFEADDVIGTLARQASAKQVNTLILTGDTDTLQLVDDQVRVVLANPFGQKMSTKIYDLAAVSERYKGLRPDQLADLRGLKGDASDNIPGVKGIGEAGAIALLNQFGTVEQIYERFGEVPNRYKKPLDGQREVAIFSKTLATIVTNVPIDLDLQAARVHDYDRSAVLALFRELEIGSSLLKRLPTSSQDVAPAAIPSIQPSGPQQADMFAPVLEPPPPAAIPVGSGAAQLAMFDQAPAASAAPPPAQGDYQAITDAAGLARVVTALHEASGFAFDTEIGGLRPLQDVLVGISLATHPGHAWYIPVGHREGQQLAWDEVAAALKPFFADPAKRKYGHNAKFDILVLERAGISVAGAIFDTMLAATLLDKRRGLKDLAFYELGLEEPPIPIEDLIGKGKTQITFDQVPIERATPYACSDADLTLRLVQKLEPQLRVLPGVTAIFDQIETPLLPVLVRMEQAGIGLDESFMRDLGKRMGQQLAAIEAQIYAIAERPFNINSGDQLSDVLFGKLGLSDKGLERTKTGKISLTAEVLEGLRERDLNQTGIIDLILHFRQLTKLKSTYVDALPELVNPFTKRVHTTYSQIGAATGRMASNDPNLQNIPTRTDEGREVRRGFIAAPGHQLVAADYSQVELRVLAHITEDANLMQAFIEGQDIHAATAARLFGVEPDQVSKNQRRVAKMTVFGIVYGISAFGLAQRTDLSRTQAQEMISGVFATYPGLRQYIDQTLAHGRDLGYVQTLFGRRRAIPDLRTKGPRMAAAEREAINTPIQGTAADIMKLAMIRVDSALRQSGLQTRMLLQVHDELIFEAPNHEVDQAVALVQREMEEAYPLRVPLTVEVEVGPNWDDLHAVGR